MIPYDDYAQYNMTSCLTRTASLAIVIPILVLTFTAFFIAQALYFALLPDIVPAEQRSTASGVMFLVGGMGMLCYLLFAAKRFEVSPSFPFFWAVCGIVISTAIMLVSVKEPQGVARSSRTGVLAGDIVRDRNITCFYSGMILWWIGLWMVSAFFIIAFRELFNLDTPHAVTAFFILNMSFVVFAFPAGQLGLRFGLKKVTTVGLFILAASLLCTPLLKDYYTALLFMVAAGAGYSSTMAVSYPFFLGLIPKDKTAGFVGIYMACQNGTLLVGPAIGGIVIDCFGYVALFECSALFVFAGLCVFLTVQSPRTMGPNQAK